MLGYKIDKIQILPFGVCLKLYEPKFKSLKDEIIISSFGPIINLILIITGLLFSYITKFNVSIYIYANIYMLLINLLPILPLDGGRILCAVLKQETGEEKGEITSRVISVISTLIVLFAGSVLLYRTRFNYSLLIAALYLLSNITTIKNTSRSLIDVINYSSSELTYVKHYSINAETSVIKIIKSLKARDIIIVDLIDDKGRYLGSITNKEIFEAIIKNGYDIKLSDIK